MDAIVIRKLELQNYRQYINQTIDFNYTPDNNICIIKGRNGFGKSNLFNAINWCFFEREEHLKPENNLNPEPICNTQKLQALAVDESITTSVKILLDTPEGPKQLERTQITVKNPDGSIKTAPSSFIISECFGTNWAIAPYPEFIISRILPYHMRNFFFIDGEQLRALFQKILPEQIRSAIFDLSQISLLQTTIDHLSSFKSSLRQEVKDIPDLKAAELLMNRVEGEIKQEQLEYDKLSEQHNQATVKRNQIDADIKNCGNKDIYELETRREELKNQISFLERKIQETQDDCSKYLFAIAPLILCRKAILKTLDIITKAQEIGSYPPPMPHRALIDHILKTKKCICTTDLNNKESESILKLLEDMKEHTHVEQIARDINQLQVLLSQTKTEYCRFDFKIKSYQSQLAELNEHRETLQKQLKEILTQITNTDIEKVKRLNDMRSEFSSEIDRIFSRMNQLKASIDYKNSIKQDAEKRYNQLLLKQKQGAMVKKRIDLCDKCIDLFDCIKNKLMGEIRQETDTYTREYFSKLVSAKQFDRIAILEDYNLLIERNGYNCIYYLSAAETLCLGYSFMAALRKSSGFIAPIIIDTPLAKVDSEYRANIADWMKKSLGTAQVILLVTNVEYTEAFRKEILTKLGQEFLIDYDTKERNSEVKVI
jgi:DNA sulfur modification protein DndD